MAGFVKLDCGLLNSTLWTDKDARDLFITALLMAEPRQIAEVVPQIAVRTLEYTGWEVPPGWYGFVPAAGTGIIRRCGLETEPGMCALERMSAPDPESRTPDHDGRRLVRVDGGYIILNFFKYRDRDYTAAKRSKEWRERKKAKAASDPDDTRVVGSDTRISADRTRNDTQAEADVRVQRDKEEREERSSPPIFKSSLKDKKKTIQMILASYGIATPKVVVEEWKGGLREIAQCTSDMEAEAFIGWAVRECKKQGVDVEYFRQVRQLAIEWNNGQRNNHFEQEQQA